MKRLTLLASIALLSVACLGSDFADSVEGPWQMTSGTLDGEVIPLLDSHPITINLDEDGQVGGTAACNGYGGEYELSGANISFGNLAMTDMACFPEETMEAEAMFADAITRVETVAVDGELTLSGEGVELAFEALEPVPDAELTGVVWVLDGLIQEDSVSTPVAGTEGFIELSSDGSARGDTGCRPFSGEFVIEGAEVLMTELAADGHECEPGVADQDGLFFNVVGDGFRVEIEGDRLTMSSMGGEGLIFVAEE